MKSSSDVGAVTLGWFRSKQGFGAQLALLALVLKLALAYGHHHFADDARHPHDVAVQTVHDHDGHDHDSAALTHDHAADPGHAKAVCFECLVVAAGDKVASAPLLAHAIVVSLAEPQQASDIARFAAQRAAFQSRAPPLTTIPTI